MRPFSALLHLLFPSSCAACDVAVPNGQAFCEGCAAALVSGLEAACPRCGLVWLDPPPGGGRHVCGECTTNPPPFASAAGALAYGGPVQDAISRWKNRPDEVVGRPLAAVFLAAHAAAFARREGLVVVPIPTTFARIWRRGFNPAAALALPLARSVGARYRPAALHHGREVSTSRGLGRRQRKQRMRGVFQADPRAVAGRPVLIVDDVMTTGATLRDAARACLEAGASSVEARVLARVPAR